MRSQWSEHTVVLVTGSMRSGTSSLAGSLKLLGWHVPQPEVPASERNAKGHFEPRWVIEFHKRLMRSALVRPSDGSPRAEERVAALLEDGTVEAELRDWLSAQPEPNVVIKDPHAAWLLPLWRRAAEQTGRDVRILTALRHPAAVVGSQDRTWGEGRRTDAERRVKETSNTAAWLNVALVTEAGSRGARRAFIRYDDLLADWRTALKQVSDQLDLGLPLDEDRGLDAFLDPGMRRSQLTWDDIVLPDWLRDLAEDAWQQLGGLVLDPEDRTAGTRMDQLRAAYDAHYAEAVAVSLDEARHRERRGSAAGAAKLRGRLKDERTRAGRPRRRLDGVPRVRARSGRSASILGRSRSGNRRRHELVGRPEVLGHRPRPSTSGRSAERGETLNRASRSGCAVVDAEEARQSSNLRGGRGRAEQLLVEGVVRELAERLVEGCAPSPRSGSARRTTARRTAAATSSSAVPGLFSGRRRFCIRTCDQIRSTGSRRRNAATARTPRRSNDAPDRQPGGRRQKGVAGGDVEGEPGLRRRGRTAR